MGIFGGANAGYVQLHQIPVWSSDSSYIDYTVTPFVYFYYIFFKINQDKIYDKQEGSAQPHIYPSHLMDLDILNYPETLIRDFENTCSPLFEKVKINQQQIRTLENLRDTLLPKLMSGEVRVKDFKGGGK
jgi:type I restriction enzyme S subunit